MLTRKEFYLLYVMFLMVCTGGLMTTGNLSQIAKSLNVADANVWGFAIVPLTATIAGATNAFARIMWGAASDRFGRENTMAFAFAFEGVLIFLMTQIMGSPIGFVLLLPFVFLAWGEIYALFSAITGDAFDIAAAAMALFLVRPILRKRIAEEVEAKLVPATS
jgi:OFA family oxalate/formate antiporter-like MFS transporter